MQPHTAPPAVRHLVLVLGDQLDPSSAALDDFDVVFGYPWGREEPVMLDLMKRYGSPGALLLLHGVNDGVKGYRGGNQVSAER